MVLVLAIGDLHIPYRSPELCEKFRDLLIPGKIEYTLCTGNLCVAETEDFLRKLSPEVYITAGDMDDEDYEERIIINIEGLTFGLLHGHQILPWGDAGATDSMKRDMGVDIFVSGHTHELSVRKGSDGGLLVNPGSATGAPTSMSSKCPLPSFVLIDIQGAKVVTYSYILIDGDVSVERAVYDRVK